MKKCGTKCPERDEGNRDRPLRPASLYNLIHNEFSRHSGHTMSKHPLLLGLTLLSASLFTGRGLRRPHRHRPAGSPGHPPRPRHPRSGSAASDAQPAGTTACRRGYRRRLKQLEETARAAVRPLYARDRATGDPGRSHPVNIESLLALRPQVVFVANYAPPAMIAQIQQAGIPVVAISLRHDAAGEKNKMNPTMADEEQAYNAGLMEGIRLIGEGGRAPARGRGADSLHLRGAQASQCAGGRYSPEPAGAGVHGQPRSEYLWRWQIHRADDGARRGAERGGRQRKRRPPVSLEQVLEWNPQVIFVRGPLSAGGQTDRERPAVAGDRCGETSPRVADAGVCQSPGVTRCRRPRRWASCGWRKTLSCALPEHRCGQ